MKSRWTTYLLLAAVVAVWGIVAWKVFAPADDTAPEARPRAVAPAAGTPVADTLLLDYPDPFLKGAARPVAAARSVVRGLPSPKPAPPRRERVAIVHLGTIRSGGEPLYILTLDEGQYELSRGGSAGEFVLTACDGDSLYLRRAGLTYGVKLCE